MATKQRQVPTCLNLGCGSDIREDWHNVDVVSLDGVDQQLNLEKIPWDLPANHFEYILCSHVLEHLSDIEATLREIARILQPGGVVEIRWPVGMNERADPDHKQTWVWESPLFYCGERHWDVDVGLEVIRRDVSLHAHLGETATRVYMGLVEAYRRIYHDGRWLFDLPATSGEFTVVMEKP